MLLHVALVTEIVATILCIHCIYGKRFRLDAWTAGLMLSVLAILEVINYYHIGGMSSLLVYLFLFIYCKTVFKSSVVEVIISLMLYIIIFTAVQFICILFASIVMTDAVYVRNVLGNILLVVIFIVCFHAQNLHRLQKNIYRNSKSVFLILGFISVVVMVIILQGKVFGKIQIQYFIFAVPAVILLLYLTMKLFGAQDEIEKREKEFQKVKETTKEYDDLLTTVRLRQHEFKNHMEAIFSAHYTHKTYEKLVQVQDEYCKTLLDENKYNNLLLLGDKVLVGFLHGKFKEAEGDGIKINYKVSVAVEQCRVPTYYVIEMLGILLNNAMEALKNSSKKVIFFEVCEVGECYEFSVKNPFTYVPYDEILEWFQLEKSEKGKGRGLGLYHLKCLCEEWKCDIGCRNIEMEQKNWIEFTLKIKKDG